MSYATISVRHNFPDIAAKLDRLPAEVADKAMARALNKTVDQGKTEMARTISKEFRVTVGKAKERLWVVHARKKGALSLSVELLGKHPLGIRGGGGAATSVRGLNLINFVVGSEPKRNSKGKMPQLKFQIKRGGGRKTIPGAFVATNKKTGGRAVFIRTSKSRMPIETITTIDFAQMFNTKRVNTVVRKVMLAKFQANFNRELRSVLGGWARNSASWTRG